MFEKLRAKHGYKKSVSIMEARRDFLDGILILLNPFFLMFWSVGYMALCLSLFRKASVYIIAAPPFIGIAVWVVALFYKDSFDKEYADSSIICVLQNGLRGLMVEAEINAYTQDKFKVTTDNCGLHLQLLLGKKVLTLYKNEYSKIVEEYVTGEWDEEAYDFCIKLENMCLEKIIKAKKDREKEIKTVKELYAQS